MRTFGILLFDDVEVLDACGPFEVFSVAARLKVRDGSPEPISVQMVSPYPDRLTVTARGGLGLTAAVGMAEAPPYDVLLVPGGVTAEAERNQALVEWIATRAESTATMASVCTGAFLLAEAGVLTDQTVTTHWDDQADLAERFPRLSVVDGPRWVQDGSVFTSAGISAGLDLALHLVGRHDPELPARVARQMDYAWQPGTGRVVG